MRVKQWFRRLAIRQAIRLVDQVEGLCFEWQTELRKQLTGADPLSSRLPSVSAPVTGPNDISDFRLAWRIAQALFLLIGIVAVVAFFNTLHSFYLVLFTTLCIGGYVIVFLAVRRILHAARPRVCCESNPIKVFPPLPARKEKNTSEQDGTARPARVVQPLPRRLESRRPARLTAAGFDQRLSRRIAELIEEAQA